MIVTEDPQLLPQQEGQSLGSFWWLHLMIRCVRVFIDSLLESIQVELVLYVILVDLAKEQVVFKPTEPLDPSDIDIFAKLWLLAH